MTLSHVQWCFCAVSDFPVTLIDVNWRISDTFLRFSDEFMTLSDVQWSFADVELWQKVLKSDLFPEVFSFRLLWPFSSWHSKFHTDKKKTNMEIFRSSSEFLENFRRIYFSSFPVSLLLWFIFSLSSSLFPPDSHF